MDARQVKTAAKLREVILALADERSTTDLTVSELTAAAGINRSTFYQHANSPTDLLEKVLRAELDVIRQEFLTDHASRVDPSAITLTTRAVLDHILENQTIYRRGLGPASGSASLHPLLSSHFSDSMTYLLKHRDVELPHLNDSSDGGGEFLPQAAARFIADGVVGVIDVWLNETNRPSVDQFLRVYALLLPAWWPRNTVA